MLAFRERAKWGKGLGVVIYLNNSTPGIDGNERRRRCWRVDEFEEGAPGSGYTLLKGMNNVIMPRMGFGSEFDEMVEGGLTNGRTVFFL